MDSSLLLEENFDSLTALELVTYIEESSGYEVGDAPEDYPVIETLQDAVDYYEELRADSDAESSAE